MNSRTEKAWSQFGWESTLSALLILGFGLGLRILCVSRGHNFDVESYRIVADIVAAGGNVYAETSRYNYGPIWFYILHAIDGAPWAASDGLLGLRWKVAIFLSLVDVAIFSLLLREYSLKIAAIFFLNPVSVIITGYHSQFDNLAVLVGALSAFSYERRRPGAIGWVPLIGIGVSLTIKHIFFIFPFWLAIKAEKRAKLRTLLIPYLVFLLAFLPFLPEGALGIRENVFLYRSFNNGPFWSMFLPTLLYGAVPLFVFFIGSMLLLGLYLKKTPAVTSLWVYTVALVAFSSAAANQYLAICIPAIAVLWNRGYFFYCLVATTFLAVAKDGLHLGPLQEILHWKGDFGYHLAVLCLCVGLLQTLERGGSIVARLRQSIAWLVREIRDQTR